MTCPEVAEHRSDREVKRAGEARWRALLTSRLPGRPSPRWRPSVRRLADIPEVEMQLPGLESQAMGNLVQPSFELRALADHGDVVEQPFGGE